MRSQPLHYVVLIVLFAAAPSGAEDKVRSNTTAEDRAADKYLLENLPEPRYEVTRREGPYSVTLNKQSWGTVTTVTSVLRLKYRARNQLGGNSITDNVFAFDEHMKVIDVDEMNSKTNRDLNIDTLRDWCNARG